MYNSIGNRIKNRRKQLKITQTQIQQQTDISSGNLSRIENGKYMPSAIALLELSKILDCSVDWILTGQSIESSNKNTSGNKTGFINEGHELSIENQTEINMINIGERIKSRRKKFGLRHIDIYRECGIASGVLSRIENGKNTPSIITFYKLAKVLDCDMTWLMTGASANMQGVFLCDFEEELINGFRKLSDTDKEELIEILQMKIRRTQKTKEADVKSSLSIPAEDSNMVI